MAKHRTHLEWQSLLEQYASSQLSQRAFCAQQGLSLSTFNAKLQQLQRLEQSHPTGFIKADVVEKTPFHPPMPAANMTLVIHGIELRIPHGVPASYVAELIKALS